MGLLSWVVLIVFSVSSLLEAKKLQCFEVRGVICPVLTTVNNYGRLNLDVVPQYAQYLVDQRVDGILVAGTTGEGPALNVTDKKSLIDAWVKAANELNLSIIIQVGGSLPDAQELAAYAETAGADAILTMPDLYYKPKNSKALVYFVQEVAKAAPGTPVLYYHSPDYTGDNVNMVEFLQLATERIPNFKGLKSEDFGTSLILQDKLTDGQRIFIADSLYLAPAVFMGFENFIMKDINLFPELVRNIVRNGRRCKYAKRARSLYKRLQQLREVINTEGNELAALKEAMPMVTGIDAGPIIPPEIQLTIDEIIHLEERLKEANIEIIESTLEELYYSYDSRVII